MRYPPDQKVKARASLLEAGLTSMKVAGFNGIGVDGLAAAAGVTSGAFYSNFANKEEMLKAIVDAAVGEPLLSESESATTKAELRSLVKKFIADYISDHHVADPANGCVMPALSADVARASTRTRKGYERNIVAMAERIADALDGPRADRLRRAWSIVSLMVGAITISRAMSSSATQSEVIASVRKTANQLVSVPEKRKPVA
ncbi:TetR/AcrR family transcriptional regulator [Mycobacterium sp. 3519A]|uniref:TetR/AcrR family transcriptional regulator n=1 Tax=Mycobacterium sp. 3519A TaxID=2057184 RepID=UPI000C7C486D|nr:TetR/AcrR family transcriptional regulator [Mycobacterium sp. 3519A]